MSFNVMLQQLAGGMLVSIEIFFITLLFSLPLGLLICFGRMSRNKVIRTIVSGYISIMRGTPLMLQLMVVYFGPYFIFGIRISMGYPTMEEEIRLIKERQELNPIDYINEIITKQELLMMQEQVRSVFIDDKVLKYLSRIVDATRNHSMLSLGVSPRGTLAFVDMSKGCAFMEGRDYVLPEDVKKVSKAVLAHRLLLNGKARMGHVSAEDIIEEIVEKTQAPKL